ncbi:T9SS type A sorting domain-containing protein [Tenacibaculum halocynthiae]|uniref:T9SS type A sorting domain-containing protein n=1 Tax=Tenacibaculum halocynthiae TaxID=1254437 RepID=UPI003D655932
MKKIIYTLLLAIVFTSYGQSSCESMFDSIEVKDGIIISSEIEGGGIYSSPDVPVISKLDVNGNVIWRTQGTIPGYYNLNYITLYNFSDGYIYAKLLVMDSHHNSPPNNKFWKIDPSNGTIVWQTEVYPFDGDVGSGFIDYDDVNLLYYIAKRDRNGGTINGFKVYLFNRLNGVAKLIYEKVKVMNSIKMMKDSKGNIYHSNLKRKKGIENKYVVTLRKINGLNFKNVIWEKNYVYTGRENASLDKISNLYITNLDEIYALSTENGIDLFKINSEDGSEIWSINNLAGSKHITHLQFKDDYLYFSLSHKYVGSVNTSYQIVKVNLETATQEWSSDLHMEVAGEATSSSGTNEAILSFNFDCQGDIYATGYYGSSNYGPGAWGIMKIDGSDGSKINDITITNDNQVIDEQSVGLDAYVINDTPVFLGNLQDTPNSSTLAFVVTDTSLSSVQNMVSLCSTLSVKDHETLNNTILISPNPAKDIINIKLSDTIEYKSIEIYDTLGRQVFKKHGGNNAVVNIDIHTFEKGIYIVRIHNDTTYITKKIIIE